MVLPASEALQSRFRLQAQWNAFPATFLHDAQETRVPNALLKVDMLDGTPALKGFPNRMNPADGFHTYC